MTLRSVSLDDKYDLAQEHVLRRPAASYPLPEATANLFAMPIRNLTKLEVSERVADPLLVLDVQRRSFGLDKDCTILTLGNATGRIESAPFWGADQATVAGVAAGDVGQVIGEVGEYRGRRQLKITSFRVLPRDSVDYAALMPSIGEVEPYWKRLDQWRDDIAGPRLKAVLALFFDDPDFRSQFEKCPASPAGHHAQLGGLLKHVWEVAHIGRAIAASSGADRDVVVAGALLHDIGKIETYRWDGVFGYTDRGRLHGHVVLGSLMLDRRLREAPEPVCTEVEEMTLQHMILSHHGQLEFGAAVPPMTLEAEVLHYADNSSAKSASMSDALQDDENFTGDELMSSRSIWQLDRRRAWRGRSDWGGTGRLDG